jgi:hypothetical protein
LYRKLIDVATLTTLLALYTYPQQIPVTLASILVLIGISFSYVALEGSFYRDITWIILLAGVIYMASTLIIPGQISMLLALLTLMALTAPAYTVKEADTNIEWPLYSPLTLLVIGVAGAYINSPLTTWIILSPLIEILFIQSMSVGERERLKTGLYYATIYTLALNLPPLFIAYTLAATLFRIVSKKALNLKYIPIDSALRLGLWVTMAWITGW